jgi:hypothetical protein
MTALVMPRNAGVVGHQPSLIVWGEQSPQAIIPWSNCWTTLGPRSQALGLADGAAVTTFPAEIGAADMTRDAAGPVWRTSVAGMGGRPAVETVASHVLRSGVGATASITVALPYTVFACVQAVTAGIGALVGGQTNASSMWFPIQFGSYLYAAGTTVNLGLVSDALYHRFTIVIRSGGDSGNIDGGASVDGTAGNTLLTHIAIGGAADVASTLATRCSFLGIYQGDLTTHAKYRQLLALTA